MTPRKIYLVGSLRNPAISECATKLRAAGHSVFDDWYAAGEKADDAWRDYEKARGRTYREALRGHAAEHVFAFDIRHLYDADTVVLLLPAGKSGHMEIAWAAGKGKHTHIVLDQDYDRWDVMYKFVDEVWDSVDDLIAGLGS